MSARPDIREKIRAMRFIAALLCGCFSAGSAQADVAEVHVLTDSVSFSEIEAQYVSGSPNPFFNRLLDQKPGKKNKKVAAVLAFPITGVTGIHRVYLGTAAYIPVVYVGTLGGCLGILPFIDFVVILIEKDVSKFQGSRKIFMWVDTKKKASTSPY